MKVDRLVKSVTGAALLAASFALPATADHHGHAIMIAVKNVDRPAEDKALDAARKPAEVLAFAGIAPGMKVLDINSAGGYYSEILSLTVGGKGTVYAHNGAVYWDFMKQAIPERFADGRLANVVHMNGGSESVDLPADSLDAAFVALAYHDYFMTHGARKGGGREDVMPVLKSIYTALKPGGSFTIVDHIAQAGTGPDDFDKLHRIDPAFVQKQMEEAGFTYAGSSDVLITDTDDATRSPFAPDLRRKTSRFVMKFVK